MEERGADRSTSMALSRMENRTDQDGLLLITNNLREAQTGFAPAVQKLKHWSDLI